MEMIACSPEPHKRFTVSASTWIGTPASTAATRAMYASFSVPGIAWLTTICPTSSGARPARAIASARTTRATVFAGTSLRLPPDVPMAVRPPAIR
jgi:hypothetical protein